MAYVFTVVLVPLLLGLLWGPALATAVWFKRLRFRRGLHALRLIWPCQLAVAAGLAITADAIGLRNPAGCVLAITLVCSFGGVMAVALNRTLLTGRCIRSPSASAERRR
jgi:hypothetical protein